MRAGLNWRPSRTLLASSPGIPPELAALVAQPEAIGPAAQVRWSGAGGAGPVGRPAHGFLGKGPIYIRPIPSSFFYLVLFFSKLFIVYFLIMFF
jgi:hypothetical protein